MTMASNERSKEETAELLKKLKIDMKRADDVMKNKVKFEDVVMFIGHTKSGKSTLINCLMGNSLVARKNDKIKGRFKPLHAYKASDVEGPEIGCDSDSKTTEPNRWTASEECDSFVLYDCPGFCDNRGPVQSITNAYYIHHIFQKVKSMKIALVVDVNDIIHDKVNSFLSLLTSVENIFRDAFDSCISSFVIIFTKVPSTIEDEPTDVDYLREILQRKCLSSEYLHISENSRNLVQHFIDHPESIGILKKVCTEGEISDDIKINVVQSLRCSSKVSGSLLKQYSCPSIDSDAKIFLYEIKHDLASKRIFDEIVDFIKDRLDDIVTGFKNRMEIEKSRENLIKEKEKLNSLRKKTEISNAADDVFAKLQALKEVDPAIEHKITDSNIEDTLRLMEFIDGLLSMADIKLCDLTIRSITERVCFRMNDVIAYMRYHLLEIDYGQLKQELNNMNMRFEEKTKEIEDQAAEAIKQNSKALGMFAKFGQKMDFAMEWSINWIKRFFMIAPAEERQLLNTVL